MLCETKMTTKNFFTKALNVLARKAYIVEFETAVKLVNVNLRTLRLEILHDKLLERIMEEELSDENITNVDFKLFSYLIWTLCEASNKEKVHPVFAKYETLIDIKQSLRLREISQILWAVTLKYKISVNTFRKMIDSLLGHFEQTFNQKFIDLIKLDDFSQLTKHMAESRHSEADDSLDGEYTTWDIMNIIWGLSKFATSEADPIIKLMVPYVLDRLMYFSAVELVMVFRVLSEKDYLNQGLSDTEPEKPYDTASMSESSKDFYSKLIDQLVTVSPQMEDGQILVIMYQLVNCPHLQFCDHTERLKRLFDVREELMKKIKLDKERIEETIELEELQQKRAVAQGKVGRSDTRSNLTNKPN